MLLILLLFLLYPAAHISPFLLFFSDFLLSLLYPVASVSASVNVASVSHVSCCSCFSCIMLLQFFFFSCGLFLLYPVALISTATVSLVLRYSCLSCILSLPYHVLLFLLLLFLLYHVTPFSHVSCFFCILLLLFL